MSSRTRLPAALLAALLTAACGTTTTPAATTSTTTAAPTTTTAPPVADGTVDGFADIPGTEVALRVPDGMEVDEDLPGLSRPGLSRAGSRSSVVVTTSSVPEGKAVGVLLDEITASYTGPQAAQGLVVDTPRRVEVAGHPAVAVTGEQARADGRWGHAAVRFVADGHLVEVVGSLAPGDPLSTNDLLIALRDTRWTGARGLRMELTPAPGFQRLPRTDAIWLSLDGTDVMGVPKVVAAPAIGMATIPLEERRAVAEERFGRLPTEPVAASVAEVSIAGHSGFELIGFGRYTTYAVILFSYDGYILISGDFDPARYPDQVPAFRAMAQSLAMT
ncbi:hypothetical protein AB0I60_19920 [Actinosynnema sp. NPDC050436]|uniref:hypothetical protein n=1 Tax=Actinosynnema sp. NPDC050436 TaxID=3155659 RepID=UPI003410FF08